MTSKDKQTRLTDSDTILAGPHNSNQDFPSEDEKTAYANELYEKAKRRSQEPGSHAENVAKLIIEWADDSIKLFGTTNQDKKVELRRIKEEAEKSLPPDTIESLRKRAEGELLQRVYPRQRTVGRLLLLVVAMAILVIPIVLAVKEVRKSQAPVITQSEPTATDTGDTSQTSDLSKELSPRAQGQQTNDRPVDLQSRQGSTSLAKYLQRAHWRYQQGQYQAALKECDNALRIDPQNREALRLKYQIKRTLEILN